MNATPCDEAIPLSLADVTKITRRSDSTIRRAIREKRLHAELRFGRYEVDPVELRYFLLHESNRRPPERNA